MPTINKKSPARPWVAERKAFGRMKVDNYAFYNSKAWRMVARQHKTAHPLCVNVDVCGGPAYITDHKVPISEGGAPYDWANLQSLCKQCNASKTGKQAWHRAGRDEDSDGG